MLRLQLVGVAGEPEKWAVGTRQRDSDCDGLRVHSETALSLFSVAAPGPGHCCVFVNWFSASCTIVLGWIHPLRPPSPSLHFIHIPPHGMSPSLLQPQHSALSSLNIFSYSRRSYHHNAGPQTSAVRHRKAQRKQGHQHQIQDAPHQ